MLTSKLKYQTFSPQELERMWGYLKNEENQVNLTPRERKYIWLKCSGAYNRMIMNPGYYRLLRNSKLNYPHPGIA